MMRWRVGVMSFEQLQLVQLVQSLKDAQRKLGRRKHGLLLLPSGSSPRLSQLPRPSKLHHSSLNIIAMPVHCSLSSQESTRL